MKSREKEYLGKVDSEMVQLNCCSDTDRHVFDTRTNNTKRCVRNKLSGHSCTLRNIVICLVVLNLFILDFTEAMPWTLTCDSRIRCLNGGTLQIPDTSFGFCHCNCRDGYEGLRCQFSKRHNRRIRRLNRLKRLVRLRNDFENLLKLRNRNR